MEVETIKGTRLTKLLSIVQLISSYSIFVLSILSLQYNIGKCQYKIDIFFVLFNIFYPHASIAAVLAQYIPTTDDSYFHMSWLGLMAFFISSPGYVGGAILMIFVQIRCGEALSTLVLVYYWIVVGIMVFLIIWCLVAFIYNTSIKEIYREMKRKSSHKKLYKKHIEKALLHHQRNETAPALENYFESLKYLDDSRKNYEQNIAVYFALSYCSYPYVPTDPPVTSKYKHHALRKSIWGIYGRPSCLRRSDFSLNASEENEENISRSESSEMPESNEIQASREMHESNEMDIQEPPISPREGSEENGQPVMNNSSHSSGSDSDPPPRGELGRRELESWSFYVQRSHDSERFVKSIECAICLAQLQPKTKVYELSGNRVHPIKFHTDCLQRFFMFDVDHAQLLFYDFADFLVKIQDNLLHKFEELQKDRVDEK